jgi:hypothetical protein
MKKFEFEKLTPEEKRALREQLEAEERAEKEAEKRLREDYNALKDEQVKATFKKLQNISSNLEEQKIDIFNQFGSLISMKKEIYNLSEEQLDLQQSHTFTTNNGKVSIIIGSNVIDRWSDDVGVGIERINKWLDQLVTDERSKQIVAIIRDLLKPNKDGVLKASRVLELGKKAREMNDKELIEAVDFIQSQYKPVKTSTYVKAKYLDENAQWQWLALSMSAV